MELMLVPLRKYAVFSGRARRLEYWLFALFAALVGVFATAVDAVLGFGGFYQVGFLSMLWAIFIFLPSLAVMVRRLHDSDRSGWWVLISFIPVLGGLILLIFSLLDGNAGPNRYGPDPKGRHLYGA
jgi:uncharacterized membrane protein YhaH (DUF805 family)